MMFDDYKDKASQNQNDNPEEIRINYTKNVTIDLGKVKHILNNIQDIDQKEIYDILGRDYNLLLEAIFLENNQDVLDLFNEPKFLIPAIHVFNTLQLTPDQQIYCNRLAYDYLTFNGEKDEYVKSLLINLSKVVNKAIIPNLCALNLSEDIAILMAMARYSSLKEIINVKRLNVVIMNQPPELMTEQMIVNIYAILFDRALYLFEGIMFDYWNSDDIEDAPKEEVYSTIDLAILDIIECLPPKDLRLLLLTYVQDCTIGFFSDERIRFNIKSVTKDDYPRVYNMVDYLERDENVKFPII